MAFRVSQTVAFLAVLVTFFGQSGPQWQVRASEVRRCGEGFELCRRPKSPDTPTVQLQHPTSSTRIQIQGIGDGTPIAVTTLPLNVQAQSSLNSMSK